MYYQPLYTVRIPNPYRINQLRSQHAMPLHLNWSYRMIFVLVVAIRREFCPWYSATPCHGTFSEQILCSDLVLVICRIFDHFDPLLDRLESVQCLMDALVLVSQRMEHWLRGMWPCWHWNSHLLNTIRQIDECCWFFFFMNNTWLWIYCFGLPLLYPQNTVCAKFLHFGWKTFFYAILLTELLTANADFFSICSNILLSVWQFRALRSCITITVKYTYKVRKIVGEYVWFL